MRQEYKQMLENWVNSESFRDSRIERKTNLSGENFIDYVSRKINDDDIDNMISFENGSSMYFSFDPDFFYSYHPGRSNTNVDDVDGFKKVKKGSKKGIKAKKTKSKKTRSKKTKSKKTRSKKTRSKKTRSKKTRSKKTKSKKTKSKKTKSKKKTLKK
jgi:hypothetical protein